MRNGKPRFLTQSLRAHREKMFPFALNPAGTAPLRETVLGVYLSSQIPCFASPSSVGKLASPVYQEGEGPWPD
jgi:hypothetical protein